MIKKYLGKVGLQKLDWVLGGVGGLFGIQERCVGCLGNW